MGSICISSACNAVSGPRSLGPSPLPDTRPLIRYICSYSNFNNCKSSMSSVCLSVVGWYWSSSSSRNVVWSASLDLGPWGPVKVPLGRPLERVYKCLGRPSRARFCRITEGGFQLMLIIRVSIMTKTRIRRWWWLMTLMTMMVEMMMTKMMTWR